MRLTLAALVGAFAAIVLTGCVPPPPGPIEDRATTLTLAIMEAEARAVEAGEVTAADFASLATPAGADELAGYWDGVDLDDPALMPAGRAIEDVRVVDAGADAYDVHVCASGTFEDRGFERWPVSYVAVDTAGDLRFDTLLDPVLAEDLCPSDE